MSKIVLQDTNSGFALSKINDNFDKLEDAINNKVLSRDNPTGDPNQMNVDLDMNGNDIFNLNSLNVHNLTVDGEQITDEFNSAIALAQLAAQQAAASATASGVSATNSLLQYQLFLKSFLGNFASDPATVGLIDGALYYNRTSQELKYIRNGLWISFPQANQVGRQAFVNGTDFIAGTSTTLTLPVTSYTKTILWIMFDGAYVQPNRYTLTSQTLVTFTAPITAGTSRVEIAYIAPLASAIVDDLSITTNKLANNSVTEGKLAALSVGTPELIDASVTTSKLLDNNITVAKMVSPIGPWQRWMGMTKVVNNVAAIRNLAGQSTDTVHCRTLGYYTQNDGGAATYVNAGNTGEADNGGSIIVATDGARWKLLSNGLPLTLKQWGAKGDGVTDDWFSIQNAITQSPKGSKIIAPLGQYRVSQTAVVFGGVTVEGESCDSTTTTADCCIIGDANVSPVVKTDGITSTASCGIRRISITRVGTGVPNTSLIGLQTNTVDQQVIEDVNLFNHGVPLQVNGQLSPFLHRVNTWRCSNYHVQINNCVEPRFYQCRFGRNGNPDISSNGYIQIIGTGVDTVRFDTCQMNQSGATTGSICTFTGYTNPNGIIHFINCHMENWSSAGLIANGGTTGVQRVKIIGCSVNQAGTNLPLISATSGVFSELIIMGSTVDASATFDGINRLVVSGNEWSGGSFLVNGGLVAITGNVFAIPVTCQGNFIHGAVVGNAMASGFGFGSATGSFTQTGNV
jgi:hypothetical protein